MVAAAVLIAGAAARTALNWHLDTPWVAPDEMLYARLGEAMWSGRQEILSQQTGYYGVYPLLAGGLLRIAGPYHARELVLVIQAVLGSSLALLTYLWALRVASARWAVGVALAVLALPALNYSAFMMTETLSLLAVTAALFLLWRAFLDATWANQLLAGGAIIAASQVRLQFLALVPTTIVALGLFALARRRLQPLRDLAPLIAGLVAWLTAWLWVGAQQDQPLGSYSIVLDRHVAVTVALEWITWHFGALAVTTAFVPLIGAASLVVLNVAGRVEEPRVQALVAVTLAWTAVSLVTVGTFVSQNVGHLTERTIATTIPSIFVCFAAWSSRRLWARRWTTVAAASVVCLVLALMPVGIIAFPESTFDAPSFAGLTRLANHLPDPTVRPGLVAACVACLLASAALASWKGGNRPTLLILPITLFVAMSFTSSWWIRAESDRDRSRFFGAAAPDWIDQNTEAPTVLLDGGSPYWNDYWHQTYWNRRVSGVLTIAGDRLNLIPGRVEGQLYEDGAVRTPSGEEVRVRDLVASDAFDLVGQPIAKLHRTGGPAELTLWRTAQPLRIRLRLKGTELARTANVPFEIEVFACRARALRVELRGTDADASVAYGGGASFETRLIPVGEWTVVAVPIARPPGALMCVAHFEPAGTVAVGRVSQLGRMMPPVAQGVYPVDNAPVQFRGSRAGYCLGGTFVELEAGQPRTDPKYRGAVAALFVEGRGLTCDPPPAGFVAAGLAGRPQGVTSGLHPYFRPAR